MTTAVFLMLASPALTAVAGAPGIDGHHDAGTGDQVKK